MITKINLKNFKGIQSVELTELGNVNYFVGKNGSGKSSLLEALNLLSKIREGNRNEFSLEWWGNVSTIVRDGMELYLELKQPHDIGIKLVLEAINPKSLRYTPSSRIFVLPGGSDLSFPHDIRIITRYLDNDALSSEYDSLNGVELKYHIDYSKDVLAGKNLNDESLKQFLNKYFCEDHQEIDRIYRDASESSALRITVIQKGDRNKVLISPDLSVRGLATGFHQIIGMYFSILDKIAELSSQADYMSKVIIIEEPEQNLHPDLQKRLTEMFELIANEHDVQFFIATHSPFLVSSAARLGQKTFLFANGKSINLQGHEVNASVGYTSDKCLSAVAKMLGAGLGDVNSEPSIHTDKTLVYCESKVGSAITDAEIYQILFQDLKCYEFVSAGGANDVVAAYYRAKPIVAFLYGKTAKCQVLVDCSCSTRLGLAIGPGEFIRTSPEHLKFTDEERSKWLSSNESQDYRMLKQKEIENYLFDGSVVKCVPPQIRNKHGLPTDLSYIDPEVKDRLPGSLVNNKAIYLLLAETIYKHRAQKTAQIYNELLACLTENK